MNEWVRSVLDQLEAKRPGEKQRAARLSVYCVATADRLGLDDRLLLRVRYGAELSNFHLGEPLLLPDELRGEVAAMIRHQSEFWNGTGGPDGLAGDRIPIGARILSVARTFDDRTFDGCTALPAMEEDALEFVYGQGGTLFDPSVVTAFLEVQRIVQPVGL